LLPLAGGVTQLDCAPAQSLLVSGLISPHMPDEHVLAAKQNRNKHENGRGRGLEKSRGAPFHRPGIVSFIAE
jgi:hypothetical protein